MKEWEFLAAWQKTRTADPARREHVYVSSKNHGFDPMTYLDAVPWERVVQLHVAGHTDHGTHVIDTHIGPVTDPVWRLLGEAHARSGGASILSSGTPRFRASRNARRGASRARVREGCFVSDRLSDRQPSPQLGGATEALVHERASATPSGQTGQAGQAVQARAGAGAHVAPPRLPEGTSLRALEEWFIEAVTSPCAGERLDEDARHVLTRGPKLGESERLEIYRYAYRARLVECLVDDYPALQSALGAERFEALCHEYVQRHPSSAPSLNFFGRHMARFCRSEAAEPFPLRHFAGDLAELEWRSSRCLHARVADALSLRRSRDSAERWPAARLPPSAAVRILRTDYPVNAFFQAFKTGESLRPREEECVTAVYRTT